MPAYPSVNTQVIGQAESALGAIAGPVLARTGTTFDQWLVLTVTAGSGSIASRGQLVGRIANARKLDPSAVENAISELAAAGLLQPVAGDEDRVTLTDTGEARYREVRGTLDEITARLFGGLPPEDLATAGRVLSIVTARANDEIAAL